MPRIPQPGVGKINPPQLQARIDNLVIREAADEMLVYDLLRHKAHCLNRTAALIWQHCDGQHTVADIADVVTVELHAAIDETTVWRAIAQLGRAHLLTDYALPPDSNFRLSRREAIRKLGLGAAAALPIVTTIVAPLAVQAQSCGPANNNINQNAVGCVCQSNNDCQNNCCGFGPVCAVLGSVLNGNRCRVNCECASGNCAGSPGTCQP